MAQAPAHATRRAPRPTVRWDRVRRLALFAVLLAVALAYAKPLATYVQQWQAARADRAQVERLERQNDRLERRSRLLSRPGAIDEQARRLGMVKPGERPYVVQGTGSGR